VDVVDTWTGRLANALRTAYRFTNDGFAQVLGTSTRTVQKWNSDPDLVPYSELQRALDTMLARADDGVKRRFSLLAASQTGTGVASAASQATEQSANAELRLHHDPDVAEILDWLDDAADWVRGTARTEVGTVLRQINLRTIEDKGRLRGRVGRDKIASALASYYQVDADPDHQLYRVRANDSITTSVLTRPEWIGLHLPLGQGKDHVGLRATKPDGARLNVTAGRAAIQRLSETLATDTRLVNRPLYQLLEVSITSEQLKGAVGLTNFGSYALTLDLLEGELLDAIRAQEPIAKGSLPLRDHYLPSLHAVVDIGSRLCAGGPLALFTAARPATRRRGAGDYVLLIQERSARVLNAAKRLAVIPKAFHEPLVDFSDDAQVSATLERELEEELFGRTDVDTTTGSRRQADPLSVDRLSAPMRWLIEHSDTEHWRMECTGFGFNLVSGNFEFASLIIVEDEEWWARFGGQVEANWESEGLRRYSSRDREALAGLADEPTWSNEGLFAFLLGLSRLSEISRTRVSSPLTDLEG
jgi:hypothetical protein